MQSETPDPSGQKLELQMKLRQVAEFLQTQGHFHSMTTCLEAIGFMEDHCAAAAPPPATDGPAVPPVEGREPAAVVGEASDLPADYIDAEHQGEDLELLQVFYRACQAEGGTVDEIHLRGLRAVLATELAAWRSRATPPPVEGDSWRGVQLAEWTPGRLGDDLLMWYKADETFIDETGATYMRDLSGNGGHISVILQPPQEGGEVE